MNCGGSAYLTEFGRLQLQQFSYALFALVLAGLALRAGWNVMREEFPLFPRLPVWLLVPGLLLFAVLGAVALKPLRDERDHEERAAAAKAKAEADQLAHSLQQSRRLASMLKLKGVLWDYALAHDGRFPASQADTAIARDAWNVDTDVPYGYRYMPGLTRDSNRLLAFEPAVFDDQQYVLLTTGEVLLMAAEEIHQRREEDAR